MNPFVPEETVVTLFFGLHCIGPIFSYAIDSASIGSK